MTVELMRDADRPDGWWLMVDGAEQSFVDTSDPLHLEFEYVQSIAQLLEAMYDGSAPLSALHLGGGLCTVPRWLAATHPGSRQRVAEHSAEIASLSASLGKPEGVTVVVKDGLDVLTHARPSSLDVVVCDVYDGPETVTTLFTADVMQVVRTVLRRDGVYLCNLSDAAPFGLTQVVAATLLACFDEVVMVAEPAVLRGRRSGNLVMAATDRELPLADITRRAASGPVRTRVVAGEDLAAFVGDAKPATDPGALPTSGESLLAAAEKANNEALKRIQLRGLGSTR